MRILLLTQFFWPEGADYKNLVLAKKLLSLGHEVTVLTTFPNHPLGRIYDGYQQSLYHRESVEGINVVRVPIYPNHSSSGIKRAINYLSFTFTSATIGFFSTGKADVVLVHATPITLGWTAALFKLRYKAPVILDVLDLWPEAIASSGMASSSLFTKVAAIMAQSAYRLATHINVQTEGFKQAVIRRGVSANKISVVPIWGNHELYSDMVKDEEFGQKYNLDGKRCIMYTGNIGAMQDLKNIVRAAELLLDLDDLRIVLVGDGKELEELRAYCQSRELSNVILTGAIPQNKLSGVVSWADALLVSLKDDPYLSINFPSKLSGYMAAAKPILVCAFGEARRVVEQGQAGLVCNPSSPEEFARLVREFYRLDPEKRELMGKNARYIFDTSYDRDVVINQYLNILERVARTKF